MESLACDVLDDDHPLGPPTRYLLALTGRGPGRGASTPASCGSSRRRSRAGVEAAIADEDIDRRVRIGFDPTHIQCGRPDDRAGQGRAAVRRSPGGTPVAGWGVWSTSTNRFHVVVRGETLGGIAEEFGLTLARVLQLNPQKRANPNLILVGEKIRVA